MKKIFPAALKFFCREFGGRNENIWFAEKDINIFIQQLELLEKTRKGTAKLLDMSSLSDSSKLLLEVFSTDALGHLAVKATLQKLSNLENSLETLKTSVVFDIDSGSLAQNIYDFKKLFLI